MEVITGWLRRANINYLVEVYRLQISSKNLGMSYSTFRANALRSPGSTKYPRTSAARCSDRGRFLHRGSASSRGRSKGILIAGFMGRSARRAWETLCLISRMKDTGGALTISNALRELRGSDARKSS